jgi:hypothetical protein
MTCTHIFESLHTGKRVGFNYDRNSEFLFPVVVCDECYNIWQKAKDFEELLNRIDLSMICLDCLAIAERINTGRFKCGSCDEWHPYPMMVLGLHFPDRYFEIPERERDSRVKSAGGLCIIDDCEFYAQGIIEIQLKDSKDIVTLYSWASISEEAFNKIIELSEVDCSDFEMKGKLANSKLYLDTVFDCDVRIKFVEPKKVPKLILMPCEYDVYSWQQNGMDRFEYYRKLQLLFPASDPLSYSAQVDIPRMTTAYYPITMFEEMIKKMDK